MQLVAFMSTRMHVACMYSTCNMHGFGTFTYMLHESYMHTTCMQHFNTKNDFQKV